MLEIVVCDHLKVLEDSAQIESLSEEEVPSETV